MYLIWFKKNPTDPCYIFLCVKYKFLEPKCFSGTSIIIFKCKKSCNFLRIAQPKFDTLCKFVLEV